MFYSTYLRRINLTVLTSQISGFGNANDLTLRARSLFIILFYKQLSPRSCTPRAFSFLSYYYYYNSDKRTNSHNINCHYVPELSYNTITTDSQNLEKCAIMHYYLRLSPQRLFIRSAVIVTNSFIIPSTSFSEAFR